MGGEGYKLVFRESAQREFERLGTVEKRAIDRKFQILENDPCPAESKAIDKYAPLRRIKAGHVRVIYDPEPDSRNRLYILRVGIDHSIYDLDDLVRDYRSE
jgi:mRNA-degrading endonuclease RelE of RelBE toxin-antitoxin system